jgi:hypothetical protein
MVWNPNRQDQWGNNWESGLIASMDKRRHGFAQRFGYWSARILLAGVRFRHSQWTN